MMTLAIESPRRVSVCGEPEPGPLKAGQVLVEVNRISLCGSDYRLFDGSYAGPRRYPIRFGHEWSGRIADVSAGSRLRRDALVTGDCSKWCGSCDLCQVDRNLCRAIEKFGITTDGFSTQYRIVEERYLYQDEYGMSPRNLALTEIFAVAFRGVKCAGLDLERARDVLVFGAGPLGLATYLILRHHYGISGVRMVEAHPEKIESVLKFLPECLFAPHLANEPGQEPLTYSEVELLSRFDVAFECSGSGTALNRALSVVSKGGMIVCLGINSPSTTRTDLLVTKGLRLTGSIGGTGAFAEAMRFVANHGALVAGLVTHEFPMQRAQQAFEQTISCAERIKAQLVFEKENDTR